MVVSMWENNLERTVENIIDPGLSLHHRDNPGSQWRSI